MENSNKKRKVNNKVVKIKNGITPKNLLHTSKLIVLLIVSILIFIILIIRIGFIQFVQGNSLKEKAYQQQTINQIISPKRGNIYDSTGKALAISAQVDTITINPAKLVKDNDVDTKDYREKIAKALSEIFELDYEEVLSKVTIRLKPLLKKLNKKK